MTTVPDNADAVQNGLTVVLFPEITELRLSSVSHLWVGLPGNHVYWPARWGTALLLNLDVSPLCSSLSRKGNFFLEQLSKTGAGKVPSVSGGRP